MNKNKKNSGFDVAMGAYDGAEVSEICGLYMLHKIIDIKKLFKKEEIGIFRDDGLSVMKGTGHEKDKTRKALILAFKEEGLSITWEINIKKVHFLDVLLDLENECYKPYHKKNGKLSYVSPGSNHPRMVLNNIPEGINRRLSSISSNEECFNQAKYEYQQTVYKIKKK